ncbi:hypothetical protein CK203_052921 [Vitis vinifera]|uniref:Uncharacterized protein n=1 Tax=Vitis vinifera TaxID=29760 RepID=A0A438GT16_VITVI|nr:hypothetical protein CK203_052921 [Vitis vinifera]
MPCYFLSLFKIPASVAAKIERLQMDFLWSGVGEGKRDHLVSWDVVCKPKAKGGLGFGKIALRNVTLLGKWLWSQMVTLLSLEGYCTSLSRVFQVYSVCSRRWGKNSVLGRLVGFLQSNLSFLPYPNVLVLLQFSLLSLFGNPKSLSRSSPLSGWWHTRRLFQLAKMDWVPPRSISDMLSINYNDFGLSKRGIELWQVACIALIWIVWQERNARIFEDKARNSENLWDSIHFLASL